MVHQCRKEYGAHSLEMEVQDLWRKEGTYLKVKAHREEGPDFYFIDGPPYTSGAIHLGTAWNKIIKDVELRYLRMDGYNVRDQAGFDMHGLPIEVKVEKELGIGNKMEIEARGIDSFVEQCLEFALRFKDRMTEQFKALGVWLDWDNPYMTVTNDYIQSAWWTIKTAHEKGLLTRSQRVLTWCPRCQTALAEAEVEYWDEEDVSIFVKFPLEDGSGYLVIWTTTPWTIPSNLAIAVNPDYNYVKAAVEKDGVREMWIIHEECLESVAEKAGYSAIEILETVEGRDLEGLKYTHPMEPSVTGLQADMGYWKHKIVQADYVTADMTGLVHTAPGHGPDDFETGYRYDLPPLCPVKEDGTFDETVQRYEGQFTKDADPALVSEMDELGMLLASGEVSHRYGHCWRCKTPVTYRATKQWFLKVTDLQEEMLSEVLRAKWYPPWAGKSRQYEWVANARDWCISRQRYWGIPLPIWTCDACGEVKAVGQARELEGAQGYTEGMNLHRPWIDAVKMECDCGKEMDRVEDILDVWFDSAVCSWAQLGYPQKTEDFDRWWPCPFITEAHDQTRGWFYSQLGAGVVAFGKAPYDSVLMHGFALDESGKPMSKSLGNAEDPLDVGAEFGMDALRFYFMKSSAPWEDLAFSMEGVRIARRTLNILWNVYYFGTTYMALDGFRPEEFPLENAVELGRTEDLWLLSRLNSIVIEFSSEMEVHNLHKASRALDHFILEDLSRWYVRLIRDRTWIEGHDPKKLSAYAILHHALKTIALVGAPMLPHLSEEIYRNLVKDESIHMQDWPKPDESLVSLELETDMGTARKSVESIYAARQQKGRKIRWPVAKVLFLPHDEDVKASLERTTDLVLEQGNAKDMEILKPHAEWGEMVVRFEPDHSRIGPEYKQNGQIVAEAVKSAGSEPITAQIEGQEITIPEDMYKRVKDLPEGYVSETFDGTTVIVDLNLTDELVQEALGRELLRRIQEMRKEMDLHVEARIKVTMGGSLDLLNACVVNEGYLKSEARADAIDVEGAKGAYKKEWDIEGKTVTIGIDTVE